MERETVREMASRGGKAAHAAGSAHRFSREEAIVAGKKGAAASRLAWNRMRQENARRDAVEETEAE
jgi:uncharacterized protein